MTVGAQGAGAGKILTWRDKLLTPAAELFLLCGAYFITRALTQSHPLGLLGAVIGFYLALAALTLVFLAVMRWLFPFRPGVYHPENDPWPPFRWRMHTFLCMNNLFLHYQNSLLPSPLRKFFSRLLGAKVGEGIISIGGPVIDPFFITIERRAMIGHEALLFPHTLSGGTLTLKPIRVEEGAVVGARAIVHPGVTVGRHAMVKAMSVVAEDTQIPPYEIWGGIPARKMGELPPPEKSGAGRFMGWRDLVITPAVQLAILAAAGFSTAAVLRVWPAGFLTGALVFYLWMVVWTLAAMRLIRAVYPFREGTFPMATMPTAYFVWSLYAFIGIVHLFFHYQMGLLPPVARKLFARAMGARIGGGLASVGGILFDPFFITVEDDAVIGHDALLLPHAVAADSLVLKRVTVKRGAHIGDKAMVMPGVTVGEYARVEPGSLVAMDTQIGPREIWRGIPARKVGELADPPLAARRAHLAWRDWTITPAVEIGLLCLAGLAAAAVHRCWPLDAPSAVFVFLVLFAALTVIFCAGLRRAFPFLPGVYNTTEQPWPVYRWRLHAFLCLTNLFLLYQNCLLPPGFRKAFGWLLGGNFNRGIMTVGGFIADPYLVRLGDGARVGVDSFAAPCRYSQDGLALKPVDIGEDAVVGLRAVVRLGARIGRGAVIEPLSVVDEDAVVPAGETWGGNPARRRDPA